MQHSKLIAVSAFAGLVLAAGASAQSAAPPAAASSAAPLPAAATGVPLPAAAASATPLPYAMGFSIDVILTQRVTSATAQVGDSFSFQTKADVNLGSLDVPAGTPGHGRFAVAAPSTAKQNGRLSFQADSIDLAHGPTVWVNIDPSVTPIGHYSNRSSGDVVLDVGTQFRVVTITPRKAPAPLLVEPTLPPSPAPTSPQVIFHPVMIPDPVGPTPPPSSPPSPAASPAK